MKKIFLINKWLLPIAALVVALTSCLKDDDYDDGLYGSIRGTEGGKYVSLRTSGLNNFQRSSVLINTLSSDYDTVEVFIDLDVAQKTTSPVTIKLGLDDAKRTAYNTANSKNFQPVTDAMARIETTDLTIPAGERTIKTNLIIKQDLFDPSKSYLIPVTILEAPDASLSSNLNTRYFNIIGNPFAGATLHDFTRFNNNDGSGAPNSLSYTDEPRTILPITETSFSIESGYFVEPRYTVSFTNTAGVYSDFKVILNADDVKFMKDNGVEVTQAPKVVSVNTATKEFVFQYVVVSGGTAFRYIIDRYHQ
jgi:Domain of unknown function (DUF1735)